MTIPACVSTLSTRIYTFNSIMATAAVIMVEDPILQDYDGNTNVKNMFL